MPVAILSQFVVRPSHAEEFMQRLIGTTRERWSLRGVLAVTAMQDQGASWRFSLLEVFVDRESAAARSVSDVHERWVGKAVGFVLDSTEEALGVLHERRVAGA